MKKGLSACNTRRGARGYTRYIAGKYNMENERATRLSLTRTMQLRDGLPRHAAEDMQSVAILRHDVLDDPHVHQLLERLVRVRRPQCYKQNVDK